MIRAVIYLSNLLLVAVIVQRVIAIDNDKAHLIFLFYYPALLLLNFFDRSCFKNRETGALPGLLAALYLDGMFVYSDIFCLDFAMTLSRKLIYLENSQLITYLRLGKSIEQWLGTTKDGEDTIIKWLTIESEKNGTYKVTYLEVLDEGSEDFLDIYEFSAFDPDVPFGKSDSFATYEEALGFSRRRYGCKDDKFVNVGLIQEEYRLYLLLMNE